MVRSASPVSLALNASHSIVPKLPPNPQAGPFLESLSLALPAFRYARSAFPECRRVRLPRNEIGVSLARDVFYLVVAEGGVKILIETSSPVERKLELTHTRDGCTCCGGSAVCGARERAGRSLGVESSSRATATRGAGPLVLATCQDPCPSALRQSARPSFSPRSCNPSYHNGYLPLITVAAIPRDSG